MKRGHQRGFTIVELVIVVVVIGIITSITVVSYRTSQMQARDLKLQNAAAQAVDAIKLFVAQKGHFPAGGDGSTTAIGSSTECADGSGGFFGGGNICTVLDTLAASDYLAPNFMIGLPSNVNYNQSVQNTSIMLSQVSGFTPSRAILLISQEAPTSKVTDRFNKAVADCNLDSTTIATYSQDGMRDAYCFEY